MTVRAKIELLKQGNIPKYKRIPLHIRISKKGTLAPALSYSVLIYIKNKLHRSSYFN